MSNQKPRPIDVVSLSHLVGAAVEPLQVFITNAGTRESLENLFEAGIPLEVEVVGHGTIAGHPLRAATAEHNSWVELCCQSEGGGSGLVFRLTGLKRDFNGNESQLTGVIENAPDKVKMVA